jgi:phosphatidate cytidylyltransferase
MIHTHSCSPYPFKRLKEAFCTTNFFTRFATTVILVPLVLWTICTYPFQSSVLPPLITLLLIGEWTVLIYRLKRPLIQKAIWLIGGSLYFIIGMGGIFFGYLYNFTLIIGLLLTVWATDIGAYLTGKAIGGPKLVPSISPNKTWAGAIGGTVFALLTAVAVMHFLFKTWNLRLITFYGVCSVVGQMGDLLESFFKRRLQVKDSGSLIPGQGGVFDRLDSLLLIGAFLSLFVALYTVDIFSILKIDQVRFAP